MDLKTTPFNLNDDQIKWVNETFQSLTIDEKIGQIFLPNVSPFAMKGELKDILKYHSGGVFLHISLAGLQRRKVKFLQENSKIPMLVCGDTEMGGFGGIINGTFFHTQMGVGATNNETHAYRMGKVAARENIACGFNWTLAPLVDINYNFQHPLVNIRSFGDRPELVSKMALAYIKGVQEEGMVATAKHWPGDGLDDRDQHLVTTINTFDMDTWHETYGKVYRDIIKAGVKSIMSSHISLPAYDSDNGKSIPASNSKKLNEDLLRKELGFNGLIVADAIGMGGLNSQGPKTEVYPKLISSGIDILLFSDEREYDFKLLKESIETGVITKKRLEEAAMRVLALKASINLHEGAVLPSKKQKKRILKSKEHINWSNECIKDSITLVKDTQNLLPISPEKYKKVLLVRTGDFGIITRKFKGLLKAKGFEVEKYKKGIRKIFPNYDLIVFLTTIICGMGKNSIRAVDLSRDYGMMRCVHNEKPTLFISMANPYQLYEIPTMKTLVNTYNPTKRSQKILVDLITGILPFKGLSPVDAFCGLEDAKP